MLMTTILNNDDLCASICDIYHSNQTSNGTRTKIKRKVNKLLCNRGLSMINEMKTSELVWRIEHRDIAPHLCVCGNEVKFYSYSHGFRSFCSYKCSANSKETFSKKLKTFNEKYTGGYGLASPEIKRKTEKTNLVRYGSVNPFYNKQVREKQKETMLDRYGVDNPAKHAMSIEKKKETMLDRYGVEYPIQNEDIRKKIDETNTLRYGYPCAIHNKEIFDKQQRNSKRKLFLTKSSEGIYCQGYEPFAIQYLMSMGFEVTNKDMPVFSYILDGKDHKYYTDLCATDGLNNFYVEVKSLYTLNKGMEDGTILEKMNAVERTGSQILLIVFDRRGEIIGLM